MADYYSLVNERDGGINGVKLLVEECETGYATDKGVECYERLKGKGPTGAAYFNPAVDRHHLRPDREGARPTRSRSSPWATAAPTRKNGAVFSWNFPLLGTYWSAADIAIQHVAKELGGMDKLKGKKISLVFHDSPYGKEPIPALQALAAKQRLRVQGRSRSRIRASSRSRSGSPSARTGPTTCCCGAGA